MRLHLFEFGDLPWFPAALRNAMTGYLAATYRMLPVADVWARIIAGVLERSGATRLVDLCSGAGGPLPGVRRHLPAVDVVRTDLYPGAGVLEVDARRVPGELAGVRTLFAAFHHFRPDDAAAILRNARDSRQAICVFEATRRGALPLLLSALVPLLVLLLTPRVRPLSGAQILFTYFIPILPLVIAWDGFASHLRTYSLEEMRALTAPLESAGYEWHCGELTVPGVPFPLPYLTGCPVPNPR